MERMEMVVYGQEALTRMFCLEMQVNRRWMRWYGMNDGLQRSQMEGRLRSQQGMTQLMCREGRLEDGLDRRRMRLFLVESQTTLAKYKEILKVIIPLCEPSHVIRD